MSRLALAIAGCALAGILLGADRHAVAADLAASSLVDVPSPSGSLAPRLAPSDQGPLVLSWLEPRTDGYALRFSQWASDAWQPPVTVASGNNWFINWADFPSVVPIKEKFWLAHWLVRRPAGGYAYDVFVAISNDAGKTWQQSFPLHKDNTDTEHGFVSIYTDADGAGVVWLDGRNTLNPDGGMTLRAVTVMPDGRVEPEREIDGLVCDCCQTDAIVAPNGPIVAYRDRTRDETRDIYLSRFDHQKWLPGEAVAHDGWVIGGCPVNGPALANSGNRTAIAWFTAVNDLPKVRLAISHNQSSEFDAPIDVIEGNSLGRVGLVLLDDGSAVVSSITHEKGKSARLALVRVDANGSRYKPYFVADDVYSFSVPQLEKHGDALISAWTVSENGKTYVRSARIPLEELGY